VVSETWYTGDYYDGRAGEAKPVRVAAAAHGLAIQTDAGERVWWAFENVHSKRSGGVIRFETDHQTPEVVVMADAAFLRALENMNPGVARGRPANKSGGLLWKLGLLFASGGAILVLLILWGLPWMAGAMTAFVPLSIEQRIGEAGLEALAPRHKRCTDPALETIVARLENATEKTSYRFRVYVVEDNAVNAFATPGGYIVVFRGLLNRTRTPEEAASVLAHEMQHVVQRHGVRAMMRGVSIWVLLGLLTGNPGDALVNLGGTIGSLAYQRGDESGADRAAFRMIERARIRPRAMIDMLQKLDEVQAGMPAAKYFSTHPLTKDRIAAIERLVANNPYQPQTLLPGERWPPPPANCAGSGRD